MASDHCLSDSLIAQRGVKLMLTFFMALRIAAFLWLSMLMAFDSVRAARLVTSTEFGPVLASAQEEPIEITCRLLRLSKGRAGCHIRASPSEACCEHLQSRLLRLQRLPCVGPQSALVLLRLLPLKAHTGISQHWTAHKAGPQRGPLVARHQVHQPLPTRAICRRFHLLQSRRSVTVRELHRLQT